MNIVTLVKATTILPIAAMLALVGCGGGGSGSGFGSGPQSSTTGQPPVSPALATGLHVGDTDPVTGAVALSSSLYRDVSNRASIMEDSYIASLSREERGGYGSDSFQVTYVIEGQERRIDFSSADHGADTNSLNSYYKRTADGSEFWLWSFPDHKSWTGDHYTQYRFTSWLPGRVTGYISHGIGTGAGGLPAGSATYNAEMIGDLFDNTVGSNSTAFGYLTLTANFADGSVGGRIFNLRMRRPGESSYSGISTTSRFDIDNGRLNDEGQFTAELTGVDPDETVSAADTVQGFEGDMLGQFYGPDAAEVAGVLNAKRVGGGLDEELIGRFGGNKAVGAEAIVTGVNRLGTQGRTVAIADDGMAQIERTATGWTATVDGHTVEFNDHDFNTNPQLRNAYYKEPAADVVAYLSSSTRGFQGSPEFDYFDVKRWAYGNLVAGADLSTIEIEDFSSSTLFYVVHGDRTPEGSMPATGTASYGGRMFAYSWRSDDATLTNGADLFRGAMTLTADFANAGISGVISELERRPAPTRSSTFSPAMGGATFNAAISGNRLSASDLSGTGAWSGFQNGSAEGAFFGPAAEEVGGVMSASDTANSRLLMGFFGADKQ